MPIKACTPSPDVTQQHEQRSKGGIAYCLTKIDQSYLQRLADIVNGQAAKQFNNIHHKINQSDVACSHQAVKSDPLSQLIHTVCARQTWTLPYCSPAIRRPYKLMCADAKFFKAALD